jgi:sRNA-binding carbon storage regulator CsrA
MGKLVLSRKVNESVTLYLPDGEVLGTVTLLKVQSNNKSAIGFDLIQEIKLVRTETLCQDQPPSGSEQSHSQTESHAHAVEPS